MNKLKHKGTTYRSTGEVEIAKFLDKMDIAFEYEFPIAVIDEGKTKIWYPDFYLKEYQMVIEYFGMYEHNEEYRQATEHKKDVFKNCGIQFVPIYKLSSTWQEYLLKTVLSFLDYKAKMMSKKIDKMERSKKVKSIIEKVIPSRFLNKNKNNYKRNKN